jgi:hypothetical protein
MLLPSDAEVTEDQRAATRRWRIAQTNKFI